MFQRVKAYWRIVHPLRWELFFLRENGDRWVDYTLIVGPVEVLVSIRRE